MREQSIAEIAVARSRNCNGEDKSQMSVNRLMGCHPQRIVLQILVGKTPLTGVVNGGTVFGCVGRT